MDKVDKKDKSDKPGKEKKEKDQKKDEDVKSKSKKKFMFVVKDEDAGNVLDRVCAYCVDVDVSRNQLLNHLQDI